MSLVGPRPNVVARSTSTPPRNDSLLDARPGITDLASIVFADEGDILADKADPDIAYNQLIRPGKSRLGLFYVRSLRSGWISIWLTAVAILSRRRALDGVANTLTNLGVTGWLVTVARRVEALARTRRRQRGRSVQLRLPTLLQLTRAPRPRLSIVIPCLNQETYLPICLDSLLARDYPSDWEILVVDGGARRHTRDHRGLPCAVFLHPSRPQPGQAQADRAERRHRRSQGRHHHAHRRARTVRG